jgi:hypothetical protein
VLGTPPALILSQDQTLMLRTLSPCARLTPRAIGEATVLTRGRFIGSALFNPFVLLSGSSPVAFARTDNSG